MAQNKQRTDLSLSNAVIEKLMALPKGSRSAIANLTLERHLDQTIAEWRKLYGGKKEGER